MPCRFHQDGPKYGMDGSGRRLQTNISIIASFGGARDFTFKHIGTEEEHSFLQENGDMLAFNEAVDSQFTHGLHAADTVGGPRICVIMAACVGNAQQLPEPNARIVSMSRSLVATKEKSSAIVRFNGAFMRGTDVPLTVATASNQASSSALKHYVKDMLEDFQRIGGRIAALPTDSTQLGPVDCVMITEPEKQLVPPSFWNTGVVVLLEDSVMSKASLEHWLTLTQMVGWLDLGLTVAIPDVHGDAKLPADWL